MSKRKTFDLTEQELNSVLDMLADIHYPKQKKTKQPPGSYPKVLQDEYNWFLNAPNDYPNVLKHVSVHNIKQSNIWPISRPISRFEPRNNKAKENLLRSEMMSTMRSVFERHGKISLTDKIYLLEVRYYIDPQIIKESGQLMRVFSESEPALAYMAKIRDDYYDIISTFVIYTLIKKNRLIREKDLFDSIVNTVWYKKKDNVANVPWHIDSLLARIESRAGKTNFQKVKSVYRAKSVSEKKEKLKNILNAWGIQT